MVNHSKKVKILLFKGHPGTGKSTLATQLAKDLHWDIIIRDDIKVELLNKEIDKKDIGIQSYKIMWSRAKELLAKGRNCICDTNLNQPVAIDAINSLISATDCQPIFIECFANDESIHRKRLDERINWGVSDIMVDSWNKFQDYLKSDSNKGDYDIMYPLLKVDTTEKIDYKKIAYWILDN